MATGGEPSSPSSHEDRRKSLTCSLCLDIFTQPKLLPCFHSFCCKCLGDLASRQTSSMFPCPNCSLEVTVPAGGVSEFQTNYYIRPEDLDLAQEGARCLLHPNHDLDLFCSDCQLVVCLKCVLTKHKLHTTQDLAEAGTEAREQLTQNEKRLQKAMSRITEEVEAEKAEQQSLRDKEAAVETLIRNKHATVLALADMCRDSQLARVGSFRRSLEREGGAALTARTNVLQYICKLQQQLQQTLISDSADSLVTMAKEMREGRGSAHALENMMPAKRSTVTRPVLSSSVTFDAITDSVQGFFGTANTVELKLMPAEVKVEERFTCHKDEDTEVYSLCPLDDGNVWVSYAHRWLHKKVPADLFQENGTHIHTSDKHFGKVSLKCSGDGHCFVSRQSDTEIETYSKSVTLSKTCQTLYNNTNGKAAIMRETVTSTDPWTTGSVKEFAINVGPQRAFDVDNSEQFFVVVEEAQAPDQPRKVKLYQRNKPDPVATYTPPSKPFNPSDVSFFSLGGKEVLMIADEAGDSVHVVRVLDDRMTFLRHVSPGCPLLVQPIALNTDLQGRLWVACRGGTILTMTPMTP